MYYNSSPNQTVWSWWWITIYRYFIKYLIMNRLSFLFGIEMMNCIHVSEYIVILIFHWTFLFEETENKGYKKQMPASLRWEDQILFFKNNCNRFKFIFSSSKLKKKINYFVILYFTLMPFLWILILVVKRLVFILSQKSSFLSLGFSPLQWTGKNWKSKGNVSGSIKYLNNVLNV